jgi:hypothetical protein
MVEVACVHVGSTYLDFGLILSDWFWVDLLRHCVSEGVIVGQGRINSRCGRCSACYSSGAYPVITTLQEIHEHLLV